MSPLEEAITNLGRKSWTGLNITTNNSGWITQQDFDHSKTCPIWKHYVELVEAAGRVRGEWLKASKEAKEMLFEAAMKVKQK